MINDVMIRIIVVVIALCALTNTKAYAQVDGVSDNQPPLIQTRYALAINGGNSYSPTNEIQFIQGAAIALFDYDKVWPHSAPEPLRFKVEGAVGMASTPHGRALMSVNMLALYFIEPLATSTLRPYIEAGSRFNFNPQLGIGSEITSNGGPPWFIACRLHHISNGGLDDDNRGINSALIQIGRFF
ncbi:MAG: acyloxyacyl hydrolase [Deltaproteobacteria bacterium]|nr:acyloxyacyl hydrolase [Deltaproteobacteria bacterium]